MGPSLLQYGTDEVIKDLIMSHSCVGVSLQMQVCIRCHFMKETNV